MAAQQKNRMKKIFLYALVFAALAAWLPPNQNRRSAGKKKVLLDYYFNNEYQTDAAGIRKRFHYTWEDTANSGFSKLGSIFRQYGATTDSLSEAPTMALLKKADVYIIVDPDTDKETAAPHYMQPAAAQEIYKWVQQGGVLLLMENDSGNAEFRHFNQLPEKFGIHFNENCINHVTGNQFDMGALYLRPQSAIFTNAQKVYIKEMCTLRVTPPAQADYTTSAGEVLIAITRVGKGTVLAVGDPWFYNEYIDNRRLPTSFENDRAAQDLVKWLLQQVPEK